MTSNTPNKITDIDDKIKLLEELRDTYWQSFRWMLARNKPAAAELWHTKSRTVDEAAIAIWALIKATPIIMVTVGLL